jgi:hypothetical protein
MAANRYSSFPASFGYGSDSTLALTQLGGYHVDSGARLHEIVPSGAIDRGAVVLSSAESRCRITTEDLAAVFAVVSPTVGLACTGGATFRYQKRADSGVFAGGSTNLKALSTLGFLYPESLSASLDSPAQLELAYCPLFDGSNEPLALTDSISLSGAPAPAYNSVFYLGPLYLDSAQIEGLTQVRLNFGIDFRTFKGDGLVHPAQGAIYGRKPTLSLTLTKADMVPAQLASLYNNAAATLAQYFAAGTPGGSRIAAATGSHCKASIATGAWQGRGLSVSGESDTEITIETQVTGTIGLSVASTIP